MRLLDRYLLRELLLPLGYCLSGFLIFWISFDLISDFEVYQRSGLSLAEIAEFYWVRTPEFLVVILPMALLLAFLYALTNHARHHELVAMRAAGLSLWRLAMPYLTVGLIFSLSSFYLNEQCVPDSGEIADRILLRHQTPAANAAERQWQHQLNFRNDWDNRIWNITAYNLKTCEMIKPQVEWRRPDGSALYLNADRAERTNEGWIFYNVMELQLPSLTNETSTKIFTNELFMSEFTETPQLIKSEIKISGLSNLRAAKRPQLSIGEIRSYLRLHHHLAPKMAAMLNTQLHGRLAEPWTCLVVVLIALPFGAASGRRNVFVGVASSIFICFSYFVLLRLGLALGVGGYLPAWLAAWLPNLSFGALGIWMTHRIR